MLLLFDDLVYVNIEKQMFFGQVIDLNASSYQGIAKAQRIRVIIQALLTTFFARRLLYQTNLFIFCNLSILTSHWKHNSEFVGRTGYPTTPLSPFRLPYVSLELYTTNSHHSPQTQKMSLFPQVYYFHPRTVWEPRPKLRDLQDATGTQSCETGANTRTLVLQSYMLTYDTLWPMYAKKNRKIENFRRLELKTKDGLM